MQILRICAAAVFLVTAVTGTSYGGRINEPGVYEVSIVVTPELTPPAYPSVGPNIYTGTLRIKDPPGGPPKAEFRGEDECGHPLKADATFMEGWGGVELVDLPVGDQIVPDVIWGIDLAWMMSAKVTGVGKVYGINSRVNAKFGMAGEIERISFRATEDLCGGGGDAARGDDSQPALQEST